MEYHVVWEIDLTAESAKDAAEIALKIQRDPYSMATHFTVVPMPDELGTKEISL